MRYASSDQMGIIVARSSSQPPMRAMLATVSSRWRPRRTWASAASLRRSAALSAASERSRSRHFLPGEKLVTFGALGAPQHDDADARPARAAAAAE